MGEEIRPQIDIQVSEFEKGLFKDGTFNSKFTPEEAEQHRQAFKVYVVTTLIGDTQEKPDPELLSKYSELVKAYDLYINRRFESPDSRGYDPDIEEKAKAYMKFHEDIAATQGDLFNAWCAQFSGKIPQSWVVTKGRTDPVENIGYDIEQAGINNVQLSQTLLDAAVTYPDRSIARQTARDQKLNPFQLAISLGIASRGRSPERDMNGVLDDQRKMSISEEIISGAQKILQDARQAKPNAQ